MPDTHRPHLANAPVAEAAVEIRAVVPQPVTDEVFDRFSSAVSAEYPTHQVLRSVSPKLHITDESVKAEVPVSRVGIRAVSGDEKSVVHGTVQSLLVSRLAPYRTWEMLVAEARRLWPIYCDLFKPTGVTRLGVRYINRIELPSDSVDLDSIFTAGPKVPPALPQGVQQYLTRLLIPVDADGAMLAIVQSLEPPGWTAVLDIDAYCELAAKPDSDELWTRLAVLRRLKNDAFFGSLHPSVWERYL